ncbi:MAG: undecaprenyldiphospho-muramoylpentapeptide beta-N-acetylglucosaminyltransferase [Oscillospiraceae bacterium]|nr:undecaprenyldiphospho-muramoylpentapeptide beta-N-acetylglucosaminyltransferase [Oscillospiraceae bacterium]
MRFLFVCGGTAGHINPALAIAGELRSRMPDAEFLFIGSGRELENRLIPQAGFRMTNISAGGFSRDKNIGGLKKNLDSARKLVSGTVQARKILKDFRPDAAVGTGGYVCYPVLKAASRMGIPTIVHESNAVPGLTTKMLSSSVDRVLTAFPNMESLYKKPERVVMTGTPVRSGFSAKKKEDIRHELGLPDGPVVVSFWGSLGAARMNEIMADMIARNASEKAFYHIHATGGGENGVEKMKSALCERGITGLPEELDLRPYIDDMPAVMSACDLVLCRAGASTLGELSSIGKPAVLVPSPNVTDNHQEKNAAALAAAGGAVMIRESECTADGLFETVTGLLADRDRLDGMSEKLMSMGSADASARIADMILEMCGTD